MGKLRTSNNSINEIDGRGHTRLLRKGGYGSVNRNTSLGELGIKRNLTDKKVGLFKNRNVSFSKADLNAREKHDTEHQDPGTHESRLPYLSDPDLLKK